MKTILNIETIDENLLNLKGGAQERPVIVYCMVAGSGLIIQQPKTQK